MRIAALALAMTIGLAAVSANAAPPAPAKAHSNASNITEIAAGCGWGFHRNPWGGCVPNRYAYYRPQPYGYYAYGYEPWNRPSPGDHVANQLNRRELLYGY